ncbi:MAG: Ig domain-containing protein [Methylococcus sp.]|nr:Ig domain-containing protein [Methylococcus sp.]
MTPPSSCLRMLSTRSFAFFLLALTLALPGQVYSQVHIAKAAWSAAHGLLTVKGRCPSCAEGDAVSVYDSSARLLASGTADASRKFVFAVQDNRPELLCSVRVEAGGGSETKTVKGAPNGNCAKTPRCQILSPADGTALAAQQDVRFEAKAVLKDKNAGPLKYEWDFGGGAMGEDVTGASPVTTYHRPDGETASVRFVRDNSRYRVRFSATDTHNRRCEDAVEVVVGSPPETPPGVPAMAAQAQRSAPSHGSQTEGKAGDIVVLPFEDLTMQCDSDTRVGPDGYQPGQFGYANLNALVYRKDSKPKALGKDEVDLRYSASSNPFNPIGAGSTNSTSQNWPLSADIRTAAPYVEASIQKTGRWEYKDKPDPYDKTMFWSVLQDLILPDTGFSLLAEPPLDNESPWWIGWPASVPKPLFDPDHGRRMPGFDAPYAANTPQDFTGFKADQGYFLARGIPATDIEDTGRVDPYPLFRVEAYPKGSDQPAAGTDAVMTSGRDFHCRGCHAKGKIAADPSTTWKPAAYKSSSWNWDTGAWGGMEASFVPPVFFDPLDATLAEQEYAAIKNIAQLHELYGENSSAGIYNAQYLDGNNRPEYKGQSFCRSCHQSALVTRFESMPDVMGTPDPDDVAAPVATLPYLADMNYSANMHKFHGQLQYDAGRNGILRDERGVPARWEPANGSNPNNLFPVKDAQGNILPMEQNCLRCHSGQREQCYRDRMFTAGVTCYQCHGDMLAVGKAYPKSYTHADGRHLRLDWFDQPDCGSCHVGSGNVGQNAQNGYFSAGVRKLAFDESDPSATTRAVDWNDPDARRFAVPPASTEIPMAYYTCNNLESTWIGCVGASPLIAKFQGPLYREGRDKHGDVPCAACHGGAHAVWPNRDPNANDNVTALQLQGHTGAIMECKVCHSQDAFAQFAGLDGGRYSGLPADSGILGGPHGMHPVNDPNWWAKADADTTPISDGSTYGGWHDNVYRQAGLNGKDQCAACHGEDHKGTRLSKTPVDLEFIVKNGKKARWKAGEAVGCDRCHNLERSFVGAPSGGKATANHPPAFDSTPPANVKGIIGQPYSYAAAATDPDGDAVTYELSSRVDNMSIDPMTGAVAVPAWRLSDFAFELPYAFTYTIAVKDGKGGFALQPVTVTIDCPPGKSWSYDPALAEECTESPTGMVTITSKPAMAGLAAGETYVYQVIATDSKQLPLAFSLSGQPEGMSIDAATGLISWTPAAGTSGTFSFKVTASNSQGGSYTQAVRVTVCAAPLHWHAAMGMCM